MVLNQNDKLSAMHLSKDFEDAMLIYDAASTTNELILDCPNIAANKGQYHLSTWYDTLPKSERRIYNRGVGGSTSDTHSRIDRLTARQTRVQVDKLLLDDSGNKASVLNFEARTHIEGMGRDMLWDCLFGNSRTDPENIDGLFTRYKKKSLAGTAAGKYFQPFKTGAPVTGSLYTELVICGVGPKNLHLLHNPTFGSVGVKREDKGEVRVDQGAGKVLDCYEQVFTAEYGIAVEHPDSVYIIGNIPTVGLQPADRERLIDMVLHIQKLLPEEAGTKVIYGNIDVIELVEKAAREKEVVVHPETDPWGKPVNMINGMRIRRMDIIPSADNEYLQP